MRPGLRDLPGALQGPVPDLHHQQLPVPVLLLSGLPARVLPGHGHEGLHGLPLELRPLLRPGVLLRLRRKLLQEFRIRVDLRPILPGEPVQGHLETGLR